MAVPIYHVVLHIRCVNIWIHILGLLHQRPGSLILLRTILAMLHSSGEVSVFVCEICWSHSTAQVLQQPWAPLLFSLTTSSPAALSDSSISPVSYVPSYWRCCCWGLPHLSLQLFCLLCSLPQCAVSLPLPTSQSVSECPIGSYLLHWRCVLIWRSFQSKLGADIHLHYTSYLVVIFYVHSTC